MRRKTGRLGDIGAQGRKRNDQRRAGAGRSQREGRREGRTPKEPKRRDGRPRSQREGDFFGPRPDPSGSLPHLPACRACIAGVECLHYPTRIGPKPGWTTHSKRAGHDHITRLVVIVLIMRRKSKHHSLTKGATQACISSRSRRSAGTHTRPPIAPAYGGNGTPGFRGAGGGGGGLFPPSRRAAIGGCSAVPEGCRAGPWWRWGRGV